MRRTPVGAVLSLALLVTLPAAADSLEVSVGLSGFYRIGAFAPVLVQLPRSLPEGATWLELAHEIGDLWEGEATASFRVSVAESSGGRLELTLPVYDFSPLEVALVRADETVLETVSVDLREGMRRAAFPVTVGLLPAAPSPEAVALGVGALPDRWWAYESVSSLWIGGLRAGVAQDVVAAIGHWVTAGGTLVVLTGADFPLLDGPGLRALLPWSEPRLEHDEALGIVVSGTLRRAASVIASDEGGVELIEHRVGLGRVYALNVAASQCPEAVFVSLLPHVADGALPSLREGTSQALLTSFVQTPGHWVPVVALVLVVSVVALAAYLGRRARATLIAVLAVVALSVLSGFHANQTKAGRTLYHDCTSIEIYSKVGIGIECCGMIRIGAGEVAATASQLPRLEGSVRSPLARPPGSTWVIGEGGWIDLPLG
ncbi:MAG: hypothetical protein JSW65_04595, partial [Candidatus Bipolaricaulota bacterium]